MIKKKQLAMITAYITKQCSFFNELLEEAGIQTLQGIHVLVLQARDRCIIYKKYLIERLIKNASLTEKQKSILTEKLKTISAKERIELTDTDIEETVSAFR